MIAELIFGKLTLEAIPFEQPIIMGAGAFMAIIFFGVLGAITYYKKWFYI